MSPCCRAAVLLFAALAQGCALFANRPDTPAAHIDRAELARAYPPPNERYYLLMFGSQAHPKRAKTTHTWATLVTATDVPGCPEPVLDVQTISWLPETLDIRPDSAAVEPGKNFDLDTTIAESLRTEQEIALWGPYEVWHGFAHRFKVQKAFLDSGRVGYQCIDSRGEAAEGLAAEIVACRACPRLVAWREAAARNPPRRFRGQVYWAKPVPGFGDVKARLLVVGLAPAANGGNRTGRIFTGDSSGDFLFAALHRAGFANQPLSTHRGDGLVLDGVFVAAAARCAPPDNRPTPKEFDCCRPFLTREIELLSDLRVILALGALAWRSTLDALAASGVVLPSPRPAFAHGAEARVGRYVLIGSYHVSQQNTNTGRLTKAMFDAILKSTRDFLEGRRAGRGRPAFTS